PLMGHIGKSSRGVTHQLRYPLPSICSWAFLPIREMARRGRFKRPIHARLTDTNVGQFGCLLGTSMEKKKRWESACRNRVSGGSGWWKIQKGPFPAGRLIPIKVVFGPVFLSREPMRCQDVLYCPV